jgi:hypothetical protein
LPICPIEPAAAIKITKVAYVSIINTKMYSTCFALFMPEIIDKALIPDG